MINKKGLCLALLVGLTLCVGGFFWQTRFSAHHAYNQPAAYAVDTLPLKAKKPGYYYLTRDITLKNGKYGFRLLNSGGTAFDMRGHKINCIGGPSGTASAIHERSQDNFLLKNGTIEGCFYGFNGGYKTTYSSRITIRNMHMKDMYFRGIAFDGYDSLVENNIIENVTGSEVYENAFAMGIEIRGPRNIIRNNRVSDVRGVNTGEGVGISVTDHGQAVTIENNIITASARDEFTDFGIWVGGFSDVAVRGNKVSNYIHGMAASSPTSGCMEGNVFKDTEKDAFINSEYWTFDCQSRP